MKKILLLTPIFLALSQMAPAQCPASELPYVINGEDIPEPLALPACMYSANSTFSSQELFQAVEGPVAGFNGKVIAYNTIVDTQWGLPADATVAAGLYTNRLVLSPGVEYTISYKYGNSNANFTIDNMTAYLYAPGVPTITMASHDNITGATATTFTSQLFTVPEAGEYTLWFDVWSTGTQGLLYLDDIAVVQGVMDVKQNTMVGLVAYPNPVKDVLTVTNNSAIDSVELFTVTGQKVLSQLVNGTTATIATGPLANGVYILKAQAGNNKQAVKFVKQ